MTVLSMLYLIGEPGVGKSATMQALTAGMDRFGYKMPFHHEWLAAADGVPAAVELGRTRPGFPGTDTLPLNVSPIACEWVSKRPYPLLLAEGDRLAHVGFLETAGQAGYRVHVAYLHARPDAVAARCEQRGSNQNESWRKGRASKAANLFAYASSGGYETMMVDTSGRTPEQVANVLRGAWPFLDALPRTGVPA